MCLLTWAVRCVRVYVCVRERECAFAHLGCQVCESVCVCERESVCVCVCERERECVCV